MSDHPKKRIPSTDLAREVADLVGGSADTVIVSVTEGRIVVAKERVDLPREPSPEDAPEA